MKTFKLKCLLLMLAFSCCSAILLHSNGFMLKNLKQSGERSANNDSNKLVWNTVHVSTAIPGFGNYYDCRVGLLFKNKMLLSGISSGYQSRKIFVDTALFSIRQVPLFFTQIIVLGEHLNETVPYLRFDLGTVLSENVIVQNIKSSFEKNANDYKDAIKTSNMLVNIGFGVFFGKTTRVSGLALEAGYKYLPQRIPNQNQRDFFYFSLGGYF